MNIFSEDEVEHIAEKLFRKGRWRKFPQIEDAIMKSNHSGGGKPIPISSCTNSKGIPCSPVLKEFLKNLDHKIYSNCFLLKTKTSLEMFEEAPENIKNKILLLGIN